MNTHIHTSHSLATYSLCIYIKFKHEPFHTYPYIPLALWCATSPKLAPLISNTTATSATLPLELIPSTKRSRKRTREKKS